jgi:hypothetical protein
MARLCPGLHRSTGCCTTTSGWRMPRCVTESSTRVAGPRDGHREPRRRMTDLLAWAAQFTLPHPTEGKQRKARLTAATLPVPEEFHTGAVRVQTGWRRPNGEALVIDCAAVTAAREGYRALGLALLGYAMSEQAAPLRIHLPGGEQDVRQIILWPGTPSRMEIALRCRLGVREMQYRPKPFRAYYGNAEAGGEEEVEEDFPREHLPFCTLGAPGSVRGGPPMIPGDPWCMHLAGTSPSHVWLGKHLLNLSISDASCREWYLYNTLPAEELAPGGAELGLTLDEPPETEGVGNEPAA